jgi:hypothetical protein
MFAAAANKSLSVIDPCNRTGKITIPMTYVSETKGVTDHIKHGENPPADAKDLSLCLLFQKGRCNAGSRCNQVHATPEFVEQLRARAHAVKSCCCRHGDVHSQMLNDARLVEVQTDDETLLYMLTDFALTPSLETAMKRARVGCPVRVSASRVCRLHQKSGCKFGRDCKNIHLCAHSTPVKVVEALAPPAPLPPVVMERRVLHVAPLSPPPLACSFRPLDITTRCVDTPKPVDRSSSSDYGVDLAASRTTTLRHMSVFDLVSELSGLRHSNESDPLDLIDTESSYSSAVSITDFDAFVDALVEFEVEPMASPQWLAVK